VAEISVESLGGDDYRVTVAEGTTSTSHLVTVPPDTITRLGRGAAAQALVRASFRFLLAREPKESILRRFDLTVIERYFPDYPDRIAEYLA
jgi:hypothetical protein